MQEELKVTPKTRTITDIPTNGHQSKDSKAGVDTPALKVTLERPESIAAREAARKDTTETGSLFDKSKQTDLTVTPSKPSLFTSDRPGMFSSSSSLLPIAALGALLIAGMSFTSLKTARTEISALTEAKATVEKSLADTQGRLSVAEKTIADIKAAIANATTAAAVKASEPVTPAATTAAAPAAAELAKPTDETLAVPAAATDAVKPAADKAATEASSLAKTAVGALPVIPLPAPEAAAASAADAVTKAVDSVTKTGPTTEVPSVTTEPKPTAPVDAKQP